MTQTDDESKLLEILRQNEDIDLEEGEILPQLSEEQRSTLSKLLQSKMLTPVEIEAAAKINEHNAKVTAKRQINLENRAIKRAQRVKGSRR